MMRMRSVRSRRWRLCRRLRCRCDDGGSVKVVLWTGHRGDGRCIGGVWVEMRYDHMNVCLVQLLKHAEKKILAQS